MADVSGFGSLITIIADKSFPEGFSLTQFADDADPYDIPSVQIGDSTMGVNGTLITWNKANPLKMTVSAIPGTEDDTNLQVLANNNRSSANKASVKDNITLNITYPDGSFTTFITGIITEYSPAKSLASAGRLKTRSYGFTFQDKTGA